MIDTKKVDPKDLLIIITTSPIQSNPATDVIDMAIDSIFNQPSLQDITIHIVCDGVKITQQKSSKYKSGIVSQQSLKNYEDYKVKLRKKYEQHSKITIEERSQRHCFAQNIRHVMVKYPQPFVLVFQHDHTFLRKMDIQGLVQTMKQHPINYIGFMNKSVSKLPFQLDQNMNLRKYFSEIVKYKPEGVNHKHDQFVQKVLQHYNAKYGLPLMPLLFWYDKVHIARKSYYLDVIFNQKGFYDQVKEVHLKTVSFVQDSFGTSFKRAIRKRPAKFDQLMAFILWDSPQSSITHTHGRNYVTQQCRQELYLKHIKDKKIQSSDSSYDQQQLGIESLQLCSYI